jgi:hypothetical protein
VAQTKPPLAQTRLLALAFCSYAGPSTPNCKLKLRCREYVSIPEFFWRFKQQIRAQLTRRD